MAVKGTRTHLAVVALFATLTVAMTWPMAARMADSVRDPGDPLFNAWVLSWDVHSLATGNLHGFFDANIFYPNRRTLAYSEHLLPEALLAAPVILATHNPVLAHNLVMLLMFLASAFAMYLYGRYLTGSVAAGVVAGIIYGFSPFMFQHLAHIQIIAAAGFPLVFLFLARFFARERWRDLVLAGVFLTLQMLANGYYAVYLALVLPLVITYHVLAAGKLRRPRFLAKLAALALGVTMLVGPFILQYVLLRRDTGFERGLSMSATPVAFVATPRINRLYHGVVPGSHEAHLFPGMVGIVLAGLGAASVLRHRPGRTVTSLSAQHSLRLSKMFTAAMFLLAGLTLAVLLLGHVYASTPSFVLPVVLMAFLLALRATVDAPFARRWLPPLTKPRRWAAVHIVILAFAVLASLGNTVNGPYTFLYEHVPGFDGLRAVPRIHILTLFSLAALAAFGVQRLVDSSRRWVRRATVTVVPIVALAELVSVPVPMVRVPVGKELPGVYQWLAAEAGHVPILELPIEYHKDGRRRNSGEIFRVYASTLHWRPLVNGYSGWPAPSYVELRRRWQKLPPAQVIEDARTLGVRELVFHVDRLQEAKIIDVHHALAAMTPPARLLFDDGAAEVWALAAPPGLPSVNAAPPGAALAREGWRLSADARPDRLQAAIDGDPSTVWWASVPTSGSHLTVDLGAIQRVRGVELDLGGRPRDFPRNLVIEVSDDRAQWQVVATVTQEELPITSYLNPTRLPIAVALPVTTARYLRLTCTRGGRGGRWVVAELRAW